MNLAADREYDQTTLSSGKKLLFIKNHASHYQEAVDTCASHGGLILLPTQDESPEVKAFLRLQVANDAFEFSSVAWLRAKNIGAPSSQVWVDALDDSPLVWDGENGGIFDYSYDYQTHAYIGKFSGIIQNFGLGKNEYVYSV